MGSCVGSDMWRMNRGHDCALHIARSFSSQRVVLMKILRVGVMRSHTDSGRFQLLLLRALVVRGIEGLIPGSRIGIGPWLHGSYGGGISLRKNMEGVRGNGGEQVLLV